jgi:WD40 repeat protein
MCLPCSLFATGSRDQTVRLWARAGVGGQQPQKPLAVLPPFPAGVTAVALSPQHVSVAAAAAAGIGQRGAQEVHLLAVGCEDGQVQVWQLQLQQCVAEGAGGGVQGADGPCGAAAGQQVEVQQLWCSEPWQQHVGAVRRLRWAPACVPSMCGGVGGGGVVLASCGEDNSVRLFDIAL